MTEKGKMRERIVAWLLAVMLLFGGIVIPEEVSSADERQGSSAEYLEEGLNTPTDAVPVTEDGSTSTEAAETEVTTEEIEDEETDEGISEEDSEQDAMGASGLEYNYAKLLQYSLYFYDANMCGSGVSSNSRLSWRGNCHTFDRTTYTRSDGSTVTVDLAGGFHDAGDHVKFGLPEAYSAFVLGMSYDTNKDAYTAARQTGHLKTITTYYADYLVNCTVLSKDGSRVEAFCCQVGQGGGGYDHGYWGAPENQTNTNRPIYFTSAGAPSTDIVSLSAAALAMQYKNFGGEKYLTTAKKLFAYAKSNNKAVNTTANGFYNSSGWEDDYCLAALLLYKITGDSQYLAEFNQYASNSNAQKPYWPLGWDNVGPAVAYYNGNTSALSTVMNISNGNSNQGYRCVDDWGSARYNTSMQYTGLLYDKSTGSNTYRGWAEGQMQYLLGNNASGRCYVVGYNANSVRYPHHRAASGYTGGPQGTNAQAHVLLGALVGGPKLDGSYTDSASDYVCNEVAIDYNATLVAAAAALYSGHLTETSTQYVDTAYYTDKPAGPVTVYNGVDYAAVFNYNYYVNKYADVKKAYGKDYEAVLRHFVTFGMKEGRQGCESFDVKSYLYRYADLRKVYGTDLSKYYLHYINNGKREGRAGTGTTTMQNPTTVYNGVDYSAVYDYRYYMNHHADLKKKFELDDNGALKHFVNFGMSEGRQAKGSFNVTSYAYKYPDLRKAYKNNLKSYYLHYVRSGKKEGRIATGTKKMEKYQTVYNGVDYSAVYDYNYYVKLYGDIKKAYGLDDEAVLKHFVNFGMQEGRRGSLEFSVGKYKSRYADLRKLYKNNLKAYYLHYINHGKAGGRIAK